MHRSHLPLRVWYVAATCMAYGAGVSANAVSRWLGVRYESIWRLMHKIREALKDLPSLDQTNSDGAITVTVPCRLHFGAPKPMARSDNLAVLRVYSSAGEYQDFADVRCEGDYRLLEDWTCYGRAIPAVHLAKHIGPSLMATYRSVSFRWIDRYLYEIRYRARLRRENRGFALLQDACSVGWRPWRLHNPPIWWPLRNDSGQLGWAPKKRRFWHVPPNLPADPDPWPAPSPEDEGAIEDPA